MSRLSFRTVAAAAAVVAGALAAAAETARAGFVITSTRAPSTANPALDVVRFFARNDGAGGSGTKLQTMKVTLSSIASPLVFNQQDLDGDQSNDVNIFGLGISNTNTGPAGSYVRIGTNANALTVTARTPENRSDTNSDGEPDFNPVPGYTGNTSFGADMAVLTSPPDASAGNGTVFATALVATGTPVQVSGRLFGDAGAGFDVSAMNPVPEPATAGLAAAGGLMLLARRRRLASGR